MPLWVQIGHLLCGGAVLVLAWIDRPRFESYLAWCADPDDPEEPR